MHEHTRTSRDSKREDMQVGPSDLASTASTTPEPRLWSVKDACDALGHIGRTTLWQLRRDGHLKTVSRGRRVWITDESIRAYIDRLETESEAA